MRGALILLWWKQLRGSLSTATCHRLLHSSTPAICIPGRLKCEWHQSLHYGHQPKNTWSFPAPPQDLCHTLKALWMTRWPLDSGLSHPRNTERPGLQQPVVLLTTSTGIPECCVLSVLLFILYHNESRTPEHNYPLLKMADEKDLLPSCLGKPSTMDLLCSIVFSGSKASGWSWITARPSSWTKYWVSTDTCWKLMMKPELQPFTANVCLGSRLLSSKRREGTLAEAVFRIHKIHYFIYPCRLNKETKNRILSSSWKGWAANTQVDWWRIQEGLSAFGKAPHVAWAMKQRWQAQMKNTSKKADKKRCRNYGMTVSLCLCKRNHI